MAERRFLAATRRTCEPFVGLVGARAGWTRRPALSLVARRCRASSRLRAWERDSDELARTTGATEEAVIEAIEAGQGYRAASIDASENEDDPLSARLGEFDGHYDSVEDRALLGPALATLPVREQSILRMRFIEGLTQSEIAIAVGVSQMHVSRLLAASLEKLRQSIGQVGADEVAPRP